MTSRPLSRVVVTSASRFGMTPSIGADPGAMGLAECWMPEEDWFVQRRVAWHDAVLWGPCRRADLKFPMLCSVAVPWSSCGAPRWTSTPPPSATRTPCWYVQPCTTGNPVRNHAQCASRPSWYFCGIHLVLSSDNSPDVFVRLPSWRKWNTNSGSFGSTRSRCAPTVGGTTS